MKHYRIITQNGKHYVQEGNQVPAFFFGEPPFNWVTIESFYTMLEAQQFISFKQTDKPGSTFYCSGCGEG